MGERAGTSLVDRPRDSAGAARRRAIFEEAVAVIEQRYDQVSLVELAQAIFTSKRQLQRAFAEAGTSFQATLHTIRMERSAELLVESSLAISEISHLVGYRSPPQFAKAFRRHYQLAPTQLRSIKSNSTTNEALSGDCKCGRSTPDPPLGRPTTAATQARRAAARTGVSSLGAAGQCPARVRQGGSTDDLYS